MMLCSNLAKEFLAQVEANRVVVVTGDTGCGKSTQVWDEGLSCALPVSLHGHVCIHLCVNARFF